MKNFCDPGCLCQGCTNILTDSNGHNDHSTLESDGSSVGSDTDLDLEGNTDILQTEVVTDDLEITELV